MPSGRAGARRECRAGRGQPPARPRDCGSTSRCRAGRVHEHRSPAGHLAKRLHSRPGSSRPFSTRRRRRSTAAAPPLQPPRRCRPRRFGLVRHLGRQIELCAGAGAEIDDSCRASLRRQRYHWLPSSCTSTTRTPCGGLLDRTFGRRRPSGSGVRDAGDVSRSHDMPRRRVTRRSSGARSSSAARPRRSAIEELDQPGGGGGRGAAVRRRRRRGPCGEPSNDDSRPSSSRPSKGRGPSGARPTAAQPVTSSRNARRRPIRLAPPGEIVADTVRRRSFSRASPR